MSILVIVFKVLQPVLLASLAWEATKVADLINHNIQNEKLKRILLRLEDAIALAVKELNQTIVNALRDMSPDGKLTAEQRANLKLQAISLAKSHLGPRGIKEICDVLGIASQDVDTHIGARIEASVHDMKRESSTRIGIRLPQPSLDPAQPVAERHDLYKDAGRRRHCFGRRGVQRPPRKAVRSIGNVVDQGGDTRHVAIAGSVAERLGRGNDVVQESPTRDGQRAR